MSYCFGNEHGIASVGGVPVASVEYPHGIVADVWERLEEADEAALVVDLCSMSALELGPAWIQTCLELGS
jgi:hypothetical protein